MRRIWAALCVLGASPALAQETWPRLEGGAGVAACEQALAIGRNAFISSAFIFDAREPATPPGGAIVLSVGDQGAYGDEGIVADAETFIAMPPGDSDWGRLHWQRTPRDGLRLVVSDGPHSWRGYTYGAYAVPDTMSPENFRHPSTPNAQFLLGGGWDPPIIFRDNATGALAVIVLDTGTLPDWPVFTQSDAGFTQACTVRFRPAVERGDQLLPPAVRVLAQRIDATLGDGRNEGTLNPTARIRFRLSQAWADVALRPWALTETPYNSRAQVDENLRRWSRQAPSFRTAYDALLFQYPRAERALANYYVEHFGLTPEQARDMSRFALDVTLRSAYTFPGEDRQPAPNPWPGMTARQ